MSWTDPCDYCDAHRADCNCGYKQYDFGEWHKKVVKEQKHYPFLKGVELNITALRELFMQGKTPTDAINDLTTLT